MTDSFLIIQSGFLGDAVLASGMLRAFHAVRPDIRLGLVVRQEFADLFTNHPAISTLHPFAKKSKQGTSLLIESIRAQHYDGALLPHRSFRTAWIARSAGIPRRIGYRQSDVPWLLTDRVEYMISVHETERNRMLMQCAGINVENVISAPWLVPDGSARERMQARFGISSAIFVMAPGSVWPTKRWTPEGYAEVAQELIARGGRVVLAGSQSERHLCEAIADKVQSPHCHVTAGELSLGDLLALISLAERVFTNDSAPLHLAESVGTAVTAMFGPTVPQFGFGPRGERSVVVEVNDLACRPCRIHGSQACPIGTHECMTRISAEQVVAAGS
jgi:heptosyltransferase-2